MLLPYVSGNTESSSGLELIEQCKTQNVTGTLYLEHLDQTALLLFQEGKVQKHYALDQGLNAEQNELSFIFYQHDMRGHIELPSRFPTSLSPVMRALPALDERCHRLPAGQDLHDLLLRYEAQAYSGYISCEAEDKKGLILIKEGKIVIALYEAEQALQETKDALRALRRLALEPSSKVAARPIAIALLEGLLALASNNKSHGLHIFNGLESSEEGYAFFKNGKALLRTGVGLIGQAAYFPHVMEEAKSFTMPDEPPGWESERYQLTLRGKDALNAITELAMNFRRDYGDFGKQLLNLLPTYATPEALVRELDMTLGDLKPWLDRLENEGIVRKTT